MKVSLRPKPAATTRAANPLASDQITQLRGRAAAGEPKSKLATDFGISCETVYAYSVNPR